MVLDQTLQLVGFLFLFGLVVGLAYLTSRFLGGRLGWSGASGRIMRVIEAAPLGRDRSVVLIEVAGRYYLVGASQGSVSLLAAVEDGEAVAQIRAATPPPASLPGLDRLAGIRLPGMGRWLAGWSGGSNPVGHPFKAVLDQAFHRQAPAAAPAPPQEHPEPDRLVDSIERLRQVARGPRP